MNKDFIKLTDEIQELFNLAMWQNAPKAMKIKDEITESMMAIYKRISETPSTEKEDMNYELIEDKMF